MLRYIRLYLTYAKRSIVARLEYKRDTFLSILNFFISNVTAILSIWFILNSVPSLEGWTMAEIGFLYGFSMMPVAFDHIFTDDLWVLAYRNVQLGNVDRLFLRPVPVLFQVIAETLQLEGLGELIVGIVMLAVCGALVQFPVNFGILLMFFVCTVFGAMIITAFKIALSSVAFKTKRSGPLVQIVYNFIGYTRYPRGIYPAFIRAGLTFIMPFMLMISYPVEVAMGKLFMSPYLVSACVAGAALLLMAIAVCVWSYFVRCYESTGS